MKYVPRIEYLTVPVVVTGEHADLLAKDGKRLCARAILLDRIGELDSEAMHTVLWRAWCRGLSFWNGHIRRVKLLGRDDWQRKIQNWAAGATRRISQQPPYKGTRPRIHLCHYADWDEAINRMLHQIRTKRFYQQLSGWGRWATFAVNNARKRTGAQNEQ